MPDQAPGAGLGHRHREPPIQEEAAHDGFQGLLVLPPAIGAEGLAHLALGERLLPRHEVGLHARDRRRDAPRRAHLAPGIGELEADRFRGRTAADRIVASIFLRLDCSEFLVHNLL